MNLRSDDGRLSFCAASFSDFSGAFSVSFNQVRSSVHLLVKGLKMKRKELNTNYLLIPIQKEHFSLLESAIKKKNAVHTMMEKLAKIFNFIWIYFL